MSLFEGRHELEHALDVVAANVLVCESDRDVFQSFVADVKAIASASLDDAHAELEVVRIGHELLDRQYSDLAAEAKVVGNQNADLVKELARMKRLMAENGIVDA